MNRFFVIPYVGSVNVLLMYIFTLMYTKLHCKLTSTQPHVTLFYICCSLAVKVVVSLVFFPTLHHVGFVNVTFLFCYKIVKGSL